MIYQSAPFFAECRAYGHLIKHAVNGKVAVYCHGYLDLPATAEKDLKRVFKIDTWDRRPSDQQQPLHAIVKDLVRVDFTLDDSVLRKMLRDLKKLMKLDIFPQDIKLSNYGDGMLLDFSITITKPHWRFKFDMALGGASKTLEHEQKVAFQYLLDTCGISTSVRCERDFEFCKKLRWCPHGGERLNRKKYPA